MIRTEIDNRENPYTYVHMIPTVTYNRRTRTWYVGVRLKSFSRIYTDIGRSRISLSAHIKSFKYEFSYYELQYINKS